MEHLYLPEASSVVVPCGHEHGMASRPVCVAAQKRGDSADPFSILALLSMRCCVGRSDGDLYGGLWVYIGDCHPVYM